MKNLIKILLISHILIVLITFLGCTEDGSIISPNQNNGSTTTTTISGVVVNENNEPLSGVTVTSHGQVKTTGANGDFTFTDITVPQNRLFVKAEKTGYYTATRGDEPKTTATVMKLTMMPKSVTHTINSSTGGSADLTNGSKVEIQAGSVVRTDGSVYNGQVNMSVKYMDPTDVKFSETVAGGDMMARRTDSSDAVLYSYGIMKVELEGTGGEKLNVTGGKPSTITTKIPAELIASAPSTIPLWYFDENTGLWREEGTATKQGDKYVGTVNHFTDWNNDYPGYLTSVKGRIVDCQGQPMPGLVVKIGQTVANTNANGEYSRTVPTGVEFEISVEPSQNFGMSGTPISIPALTQNQVYQVPLCQLACYPSITGRFKDCNGNDIYGIISMTWDNRVQGIMPTQAGDFKIYVAPGKSAHLRFTSYNGDIIDTVLQTPSSPVNLNIGELRSCSGQGQCENSFIINGMGYNNQYVKLNNAVTLGIYSIPDSMTVISGASMDSSTISLVFPGKNTGFFTECSGVLSVNGAHFVSAETTNITVTAYGNVGDYISGTFEGQFIASSNGGTVTITNGKFCAIRQNDGNKPR